MATVTVTGGSGFIGAHVALRLLHAGHRVRATVRDPAKEAPLRALLARAGAPADAALTIAVADLEHDEGWAEAMRGADHAIHVASPFHIAVPRDEQALIRPAREGTLRVLRAARDAGVRRVVLTSSVAAVGYGHPDGGPPLTEDQWSDVSAPDCQPYMKSKTLAERAAWEFVAREGGIELATVNPAVVLGPVLGPDLSDSVAVVRRLLDGSFPAIPRLYFGVVDVRDVADLHLRAMTAPEAAGERFLAVSGAPLALIDIAALLRARLGGRAARVPRRQAPDWLVRALALVNREAREAAVHIGRRREASADKARRLLGWSPRAAEEAILATAESLLALGAAPR